MSVVYIAPNAAEPLQVAVVDASGEPITGLTDLFVRVRRQSDGFYWNWTSGAYESAPAAVDRDKALAEVDSARAPGLYGATLPGTATATGKYIAWFDQSPGTSAMGLPISFELHAGQVASQTSVDTLPTALAIADAVLDEALSGHANAGSTGEALGRIDAAVSSRATNAGVWTTAEGTPSIGTMGWAQVLMRKWIMNRHDVSTTNSGQGILYADDAVTPLLTYSLRDGAGNPIVTPTGSPARRGAAT